MNKEVFVAIFIGITLGVVGALYINTKSNASRTPTTVGKNTTEISVLPSPKGAQTVQYSGIPAGQTVVNSSTFSLKVGQVNDTVFIFQTYLDILSSRHAKPFAQTITLKPGFNRIIVSAVSKNNIQNNTYELFYLPVQVAQLTITETAPKATSEAEVLKDKLEKKVMELRYEAKKAVHGTVKESSDKSLSVLENGKTISIKLEPEVTKFYEVTGEDVVEIKADDVKKGDVLTVFISQLPEEEKSYTVYKDNVSSLIAGKIADIDTTDFRLTVLDLEQSKLAVDVENTTNQQAFNKETGKVEKYGFSKLQIGEQVFIRASKYGDSYTASSYVVIPN